MAQQTFYFGACSQATLSAREARNLSRTNNISVHEGDRAYVLEGTPILARNIIGANGEIRRTKDGEEIRELSTVICVIRANGSVSVGKVTLTWLAGEDLSVEKECELLPCKDGVRKYAATWKLTKISTRDFGMDLYAGQTEFSKTLSFVGAEPIEGYKAPDLDEVWVYDSIRNEYVNKSDLGDTISLKKVRRASLSLVSFDLKNDMLKKLTHLRDEAVKSLISTYKKAS